MSIEFTPEERTALIILLTVEIEASRFPLSPRIEMLKAIREKLRRDADGAPAGRPAKRS